MKVIKEELIFEWDKGNKEKNWVKHNVKNEECEETFYDSKNIVSKDIPHSNTEVRYELLGKTKNDRKLYITFTTRDNKLRVISARDQNKKERLKYAKQKVQKNTNI